MSAMAIRSFVFAGTLFALAHAETLPSAPVPFGQFGLDLTAQEKTVKPGNDFYHYANGHWLTTSKIPADRASWGVFDALSEQSTERVRTLIQGLPANAAAGTLERKVG